VFPIVPSMTGTFSHLVMAMAFFVGSHFVLSSLPVRGGLIRMLGEQGFRGLYSVVALAALVWVVLAYGEVPRRELWPDSQALRLTALVIMPFAAILLVAALPTRNVTMVGGESVADDPHPTPGIMTITRHPMLNGVVLFALAHLLANGDSASAVLFAGLAILAVGGMMHIDYRRQRSMGSAWGPIAMSTSAIPFVAVLQGRTHVDWAGIGVWRVVAGLALYAALIAAHQWVGGVAIWTP